MRDVALAHGIQMFVMATGGSVMADTEAAHLAQSIPQEFIQATWSCQDMLTVDVAPGKGCRTVDGILTVEDQLARLSGNLPFAALAFRGKIEQSIKDELAKLLR